MEIDVVKFVYVSGIDSEIETLGSEEGAGQEGFMRGTEEDNVNIEGNEGEGVCAVYGGPL